MKCPECNGAGSLYKVKLKDGQTVYMSANNTFDKDTQGGHLGYTKITCQICRGTGKIG